LDCAECRKKLKEYAEGVIEPKLAAGIEEHVEKCPICKKELLLWQDVMDKQAAIRGLQRTLPSELRERLKYRAKLLEKEMTGPPVAGRLKAFSTAWGSPKVRLILHIFFLMAVMLFSLWVLRGGKNILATVLVIFGFAVVFIVMIFKRVKKK